MKSLSIPGIAGQADLKGKKSKLLSCGCCVIKNLKCKFEKKNINIKIYEKDCMKIIF